MKHINITELCDIKIGRTPKRSELNYWGKGYTWLSIADMKSKYIYTSKEEVNDLAIKECNMKAIPKNTVIMSFKLSIGKVAITKKELYTNEAIAAFIVKDDKVLLPEYLYYVLSSYNFDSLMDRAAKGKTLNKRKLAEINVPVISIEEQREIIETLNRTEAILEKRQQQIELLSTLKKSVFLDMFGDPTINKKDYKLSGLSDLCVEILGGGTPSKKVAEYYVGDIPWVTPKDMKVERISKSIDYINEDAIENSSAKLIPKNSLLMVIRSGILKHSLPIAINDLAVTVNQDMKAFVIDENKIKVEYLYYFFKTIEKRLLSRVRSVTAHNLDFKELRKLKVPTPHINEQMAYSRIVRSIDSQIEVLNKQLVLIKELYNSTLSKAFNEELFK